MGKEGLGIGTLIALALLILTYLYYSGYFKSPEIISVQYSSETVCPEYLQFLNSGPVDFSLMYRNTGDKNIALTVSVRSNEVSFDKSNKTLWIEGGGEDISFTFKILNQTLPSVSNFTIYHAYSYSGYAPLESTCVYNKTSSYSSSFKLVKG